MTFLFLNLETETRARITGFHRYPDDPVVGLSEEEKTKGIYVVEYNEPPIINGKTGISYVNPKNGEVFYEYVDNNTTNGQELAEIRAENENLKQAVADLTMTLAAMMG
ncbi:hypothetical protein D3C71_1382560 [compost metagenome]